MVNFNLLLTIFLGLYVSRAVFQYYLNRLNIFHLRLHGSEDLEVLRDFVDQEKVAKISAYNLETANFSICESLLSQVFFLVILLSGFLPWLVATISPCQLNSAVSGLIFWGILGIISALWQIPFSLYENFVIEFKYGFNTKTLKLWLTDLLKSLLISLSLGGLLLYLLLSLINYGGHFWWFWAWIILGLVELLIIFLYPVLIAPWFNKFTPLTDEDLERSIRHLLEKVGLRDKGIFQMDASKRSRHTNAYFTGLGKSKRIVLFDTLLNAHPKKEILAILAHEIGHWQKGHLLKQLILTELISLIGLYLAAKLITWPQLYQTFGFAEPLPYVGLLLVGALASPLAYFLQPLGAAISRKYEREADEFSWKLLGSKEAIINALKRLGVDNLSNLNPHPIYAWFYYSHPPLLERINYILSK